MLKSILYAGPFVGEFGYELFCWQGFLRKISKTYKKIVVACQSGHETLYKDFASEVIPFKLNLYQKNMWAANDYKPLTFEKIFNKSKGEWIKPNQCMVRYDHRHKLDKEPFFNQFKNQEFVELGKEDKGYGILFHVRNKKNIVNDGVKSDYRNWDESNWNRVRLAFEGLSIACIGTKKEALYIDGTYDLRDISLENLCDVMKNSRVLISPSSGPVHLASLCKCPTITWWGEPYGKENEIRFTKDWNPFASKVFPVYNEKWQPDSEEIIEKIDLLNL